MCTPARRRHRPRCCSRARPLPSAASGEFSVQVSNYSSEDEAAGTGSLLGFVYFEFTQTMFYKEWYSGCLRVHKKLLQMEATNNLQNFHF